LGGAASDDLTPALAQLTPLELLYLEGPAVTDRVFEAVEPLARLRNLLLMKTAVSSQGVARFQAAHRLTEVRAEPPPATP
jgi:hypothetical protein